eukprot:GHVP01013205.1.p1 GENE.GHVP01013205.1~~GHVP01013205.1.p1  ORF type:complete len:506 (-),score=126.58 GHVP01013205.1:37-1554(-)
MKKKQVNLLKVALTATSGIPGLTIAQENSSCSSAADLFQETLLEYEPIATYVDALKLNMHERKLFEEKWGFCHPTMKSETLTDLLPLMTKALEDKALRGFNDSRTKPFLYFEKEDSENLKKFNCYVGRDSPFHISKSQEYENQFLFELDSVSVEKIEDQYIIILNPETYGDLKIFVPFSKESDSALVEFFEKLWLAIHPSESLSLEEREMVEILVQRDSRSIEVPLAIIEEERIRNLGSAIEVGKEERTGCYTNLSYFSSFCRGAEESQRLLQRATLFETPTLSLIQFCRVRQSRYFVVASKKGENTEFDACVQKFGVFVRNKTELQKYLKGEDKDKKEKTENQNSKKSFVAAKGDISIKPEAQTESETEMSQKDDKSDSSLGEVKTEEHLMASLPPSKKKQKKQARMPNEIKQTQPPKTQQQKEDISLDKRKKTEKRDSEIKPKITKFADRNFSNIQEIGKNHDPAQKEDHKADARNLPQKAVNSPFQAKNLKDCQIQMSLEHF